MNKVLGGLKLVGLSLLLAAAVSVACGREPAAPLPVETTAASASATAPVASTSAANETAAPMTAATAPATAATAPVTAATAPPAEAQTAITQTTEAADTPQSEGASEPLRVIRSRSVTTPSTLQLVGSSGFHLSQAFQGTPTEGALTVSAIGSVTLAADEAYVVIATEQFYGPSGPARMSAEDRNEIIAKLAELGVPEEAIEIEELFRYGASSISVEVELDELEEKSQAILDAVESVLGRAESHGLRFRLLPENCDRALSLARREAVPGTEMAADDLALALGVERGVVIGAVELPGAYPSFGFGLPGAGDEGCSGQASDPYSGFASFDSKPEVEISVNLQVAYLIVR